MPTHKYRTDNDIDNNHGKNLCRKTRISVANKMGPQARENLCGPTRPLEILAAHALLRKDWLHESSLWYLRP